MQDNRSNDKNKIRFKKKPEKRKSKGRERWEQKISSSENLKKKSYARIPSRLERLIEEYITNKTGKPVDDPKTLGKIRQSILAQKAGYWSSVPYARYGRAYDVFAYLTYQFPGYLIQFREILKKIETRGDLPDSIALLDLGTGPGVIPLAAIWHQKERKKGTLSIHGVEQSEEFIEAYNALVPAFSKGMKNVSLEPVSSGDITRPADTSSQKPPENLTLITLQNVLAELSDLSLEEKADFLMQYLPRLSDDGFLIIVEPAELRHSTSLRLLQKKLQERGLFVYAPCSNIWEKECNPEDCWSFARLPPISPTRLMTLSAGDEETYRFINTDIKFSYAIFSKKERLIPNKATIRKGTIPLVDLEDYAGEWVSVTAAKMSPDIGNREYAVFLVCDGSMVQRTYLVIPRSLRREEIKPAYVARYGDVLSIRDVRVRWNSKKKAYNLVAAIRTHVSVINI